ncbi:MAG: hypothetical protein P8Z79_11225 [Sedimentisphaerales bacterium]|jgi:hypothetical protein
MADGFSSSAKDGFRSPGIVRAGDVTRGGAAIVDGYVEIPLEITTGHSRELGEETLLCSPTLVVKQENV